MPAPDKGLFGLHLTTLEPQLQSWKGNHSKDNFSEVSGTPGTRVKAADGDSITEVFSALAFLSIWNLLLKGRGFWQKSKCKHISSGRGRWNRGTPLWTLSLELCTWIQLPLEAWCLQMTGLTIFPQAASQSHRKQKPGNLSSLKHTINSDCSHPCHSTPRPRSCTDLPKGPCSSAGLSV